MNIWNLNVSFLQMLKSKCRLTRSVIFYFFIDVVAPSLDNIY